MTNLFLQQFQHLPLAVYGLGTETERFLKNAGKDLKIVCLLDSFREDGTCFGYSVFSLEEAILAGVKWILVIARPGSCKVIAKRIANACAENSILLYDIRGRDLLSTLEVTYHFNEKREASKEMMRAKAQKADVISFDLFDTLLMRKVWLYTDLFDLLNLRLEKKGITISDFAKKRLSVEKSLSKDSAPTLEEIYLELLKETACNAVSPEELAAMEWELDFSTLILREDMAEFFREMVSAGKAVAITTDTYYRETQIREILSHFELNGYQYLFVSCEERTSKAKGLFEVLKNSVSGKRILHIGDDEISDIQAAQGDDFDTFRIYSGADLFEMCGGFGMEKYVKTLSDRLKIGLFISRLFNSPFYFEMEENPVEISTAWQIGYLLCAPVITDFLLWMKEQVYARGLRSIFFCARDGYLPQRLYKKIDKNTNSVYFLTSRTAAIRSGVESQEDLSYVDSMKYHGARIEALRARFGLSPEDLDEKEIEVAILERAKNRKKNYRAYLASCRVADDRIAVFDFVAKGTTQHFLGRICQQRLQGFYFLRLEPEYMADKGLDIEPFYGDAEADASAIFENYYILETLLTSPEPQLLEFNENGTPIFAKETRSPRDLETVERMQTGVETYFDDYIQIMTEDNHRENKALDEALLALVNRIQITDQDFLDLNIEDPFFGRMTAMENVLGNA